YAAMGGKLHAGEKVQPPSPQPFDINTVSFATVSLVSPGRSELLTDCGGTAQGQNEPPYVRAIHIGDNPDLSAVERPLIALEVDTLLPDGGHSPTRWMRVDPDPLSDAKFHTCGTGLPRH